MQKDWQPDRRVSLALAAAGAALLGVFFLSLLRSPGPETGRPILSLSLAALPKPPPRPRHQVNEIPLPSAAPQPLMPAANVPPVPDLRQVMQDVARESAADARPGAFLELPAEQHSDLTRALRAPGKSGRLQQGQSYRSIYGDAIAKVGDGCASMQELQIGPSPTNRVIVEFSVDCPGEYQPTMTDALTAWAATAAKQRPLPP